MKAFEFYGRELTFTNRPVLFCPDLKALWHCSSYPLLNKSKCQGCHYFLAKKTKWLYNSALHIGREQSYFRRSEWFVLKSLAICLENPFQHCQSLTDHNRLTNSWPSECTLTSQGTCPEKCTKSLSPLRWAAMLDKTNAELSHTGLGKSQCKVIYWGFSWNF